MALQDLIEAIEKYQLKTGRAMQTLPQTCPYNGWPIVIHQKDNFSPLNGAFLPLINFDGEGEPLIQALSPAGEVIWSIRVFERSTDLKVPSVGNYILKASLNNIEKEFNVSATHEISQRGELTLEL